MRVGLECEWIEVGDASCFYRIASGSDANGSCCCRIASCPLCRMELSSSRIKNA
ncbi:hypothetical protein F2Q68_00029930 [Brassica cretica]|uniref:Uncharacterized protein n=1 Tax=Brassica cretica TaxID=69181 RepID=A0A8S9GDB3_BRACR|nr:hypothetical protein F2Q68_00029930 [Brassica cretica]